MKFRILYTLFGLAFGLFLFTASSGGRASVAGEGNTGAPGDATNSNGTPKTCVTCHNSSTTMAVTLDIVVLDEYDVVATEYLPGQTYEVRVVVEPTMGTPAAYGFQMVALQAPQGEDGPALNDSWANPSDNAKIAQAGNGRKYVEQKGPSATNEFTVQWTAPPAGSGTVTFYACGNGVNGNGSNSGDAAACAVLELPEGVVNSLAEAQRTTPLRLWPNPLRGHVIRLSANEVWTGPARVRLHDIDGRLVWENTLVLNKGAAEVQVPDLTAGVYLLHLLQNDRLATARIIVSQ